MLERSVGIETGTAYSRLKSILQAKGCAIVSEEPLKHIFVKHGSLRGVSPRTAKKMISYQMFPEGLGTRIVARSSISSDWVNLTIWGSVAAGFVAGLFWWIAIDMTAFLTLGISGYWTWLAFAFGYPNVQYALFMTAVTKALSMVLFAAIVFEVFDFLLVHRKIDIFAAETLDELAQKR